MLRASFELRVGIRDRYSALRRRLSGAASTMTPIPIPYGDRRRRELGRTYTSVPTDCSDEPVRYPRRAIVLLFQ